MSTRVRFFVSVLLAIDILHLSRLHPPVGPLLAAALVGTVILGQKIDLWLPERRERAILLAEAESQHEAYLAGDDDWGLYGIKSSVPTIHASHVPEIR